jgi:molecular chaperone DnaJ
MGFIPAQSSASESKTWWNILQVDRSASWQEIKAAWRKRAKETHPDQGGNADDYRAVQDAYEEAMEEKGQAPR